MACTIIVPQPGIEPGTSAVSAQSPKGGFLTTEPPGTSHYDFFLNKSEYYSIKKWRGKSTSIY